MKFFFLRIPADRRHTPLSGPDSREPTEFSFAVPRDSWFWLELLDWDPEWPEDPEE